MSDFQPSRLPQIAIKQRDIEKKPPGNDITLGGFSARMCGLIEAYFYVYIILAIFGDQLDDLSTLDGLCNIPKGNLQ